MSPITIGSAAAAVALCAALPATAAAVDPPGLTLPGAAPAPVAAPPSPWFKPLASDLIPAGDRTLQVGATTLDLGAAPPLAAMSAPQPFALADCDTGACIVTTEGTVIAGRRRVSLGRRQVALGAGATRALLVALPERALAGRRPGEALRLRLTVATVAGSGDRGRAVVPFTIR